MADLTDERWDVLERLVELGWVKLCWVPVGYAESPVMAPGVVVLPVEPLGFAHLYRLAGEDEVLAFLSGRIC